jgi:YD repeat-containing protein
MTMQVDCCQLKSFTYSGAGPGGIHDYAYPISVTSGGSGTTLTTRATYDFPTGLVATATDENNQVTSFYYNADSLRAEHTDIPDGGQIAYHYSDALTADAAGRYHFFTNTSTRLNSSRVIESYRFFDGRGAVTQTFDNYAYQTQLSGNSWSTQDLEYDNMGRAYRASNPYYAGGYGWVGINPDGFWTTSSFDKLGRVTQVTMPTGDNSTSSTTSATTAYDGIYTTVTDQAGKVRRQKVDALGRVVRLDEPTTSGLGSTTSPNQATNYTYDALDNLVRINHGSQDRYFTYDSLSRPIRERQVEQNTNSSYDLTDAVTGNSFWSRKMDYNSSGLVTDAFDARSVHTQFSYDGLNRVSQISYSNSTPTAHYYYDAQTLPTGAPSYTHSNSTGRLLAMTYGSGATGNYFAYDSMGRVVTQKQLTGSTTYGLSYTYNLAGELTGETYPSGRALSYADTRHWWRRGSSRAIVKNSMPQKKVAFWAVRSLLTRRFTASVKPAKQIGVVRRKKHSQSAESNLID